jgi:hypothetical protein
MRFSIETGWYPTHATQSVPRVMAAALRFIRLNKPARNNRSHRESHVAFAYAHHRIIGMARATFSNSITKPLLPVSPHPGQFHKINHLPSPDWKNVLKLKAKPETHEIYSFCISVFRNLGHARAWGLWRFAKRS